MTDAPGTWKGISLKGTPGGGYQPREGTYVYYDSNGDLKVVVWGLLSNGTWDGPVPENLKAPGYHEPFAGSRFIVPKGDPKYPAGTVLVWDPASGFVDSGDKVAACHFTPNGVCDVEGFAPGGQYFRVGATNSQPSAPPGTVTPIDATAALQASALAFAAAQPKK